MVARTTASRGVAMGHLVDLMDPVNPRMTPTLTGE